MQIRQLLEQLQNKAITELNEVPTRLQQDLDHILEWINQQPHLIIRTDKQWLVIFLRSCKYSLEKVKEKLDAFYTVRLLLPEILKDRDPFSPSVQEVFKRNMVIKLPEEENLLAPGRTLLRFKEADAGTVSVKGFLKADLMLTDVLLYEDDAYVINGQEIVVDLEGMPYNYLAQLGPSTVKAVVFLLQTAYPINVKGIYFLNTPTFIQNIVNMFISLLSEKIKNRIRFYGQHDSDNLFKIIPRDIFPEEYGGKAGSISELSEKAIKMLEEHHAWFQEDSKYGSDEGKRLGKSKLSTDLFGMDGSFRQLAID